MKAKGDEYRAKGTKMQDLIGIRVVFYFQDDVRIFHNKMKSMEGYDPKNESNSTKELEELSEFIRSMDEDVVKKNLLKLLPFHDKIFMPERLNVVMAMDKFEQEIVKMELESQRDYDSSLIDYTYEVQLRTVLSEGWHEVEHDLRYKTKDESWWNYCGEESRMLNGLYASIETNEDALSRMIDEITYKNFQNHSWDAMIRFHFRRRTSGAKLSDKVCGILDDDERLAKSLLHISREDVVHGLWEIGPVHPISTDFLFFLINRKFFREKRLADCEPMPIKVVLDKVYGQLQ